MDDDVAVRWKQRFSNYKKALAQLSDAIAHNSVNPPDLIKEGIIQRFEFTHELAWKVMKDFLTHEGFQNLIGSRSSTREAFNKDLITEGQLWMDMIESRNKTVHTYQESILESEFGKIVNWYFKLFLDFESKMETFL